MFKKQEGEDIGVKVSLDKELMPYGKHRGKTFEYIADNDPDYIVWLYEKVKNIKISKSLYLACKRDDDDIDLLRDDYDG